MKPNKTLGQNFLKSRRALSQIVRAAKISLGEKVLEVGPGKGVLTEALLKAGANVVAVEKDENLVILLEEKFASEISEGRLKIRSGDILELENEGENLNFFEKEGFHTGKYKIVANIPYYITGQFLRKFMSGMSVDSKENFQPSLMVLLLQKEVVKRIIARDGKESILSISVKAYGDPKLIDTVKRTEFSPAPNVDSAIILIENISKKNFTEAVGKKATLSEEKFFEIVRAGFAHKRKKLIRNLESLNNSGKKFVKEKLEKIFVEENISENTRPEDVSLEIWFSLAKKISRLND